MPAGCKAALQASPEAARCCSGPLDFRARFKHKPLAPVGKPSNWAGDAYRQAGWSTLQTLARYLGMPLTIHAGRIDNAILGHLRRRPPAFGGRRPAEARTSRCACARRSRGSTMPTVGFGWDMQLDAGHDCCT